MHKSSFAQLIIPRIGAHNGGNNGIDHIILNRAVSEGGPEALGISLRTLAVSGFAVLRLAYRGESGIPGILDVVERRAGRNFEFLSRSKRRNMRGIFQGQKIRQGEEQTVIRGALILLIFGVLTRLSRLRLRLGRGGRGRSLLLLLRRGSSRRLIRLACGWIGRRGAVLRINGCRTSENQKKNHASGDHCTRTLQDEPSPRLFD